MDLCINIYETYFWVTIELQRRSTFIIAAQDFQSTFFLARWNLPFSGNLSIYCARPCLVYSSLCMSIRSIMLPVQIQGMNLPAARRWSIYPFASLSIFPSICICCLFYRFIYPPINFNNIHIHYTYIHYVSENYYRLSISNCHGLRFWHFGVTDFGLWSSLSCPPPSSSAPPPPLPPPLLRSACNSKHQCVPSN